MPRTKPEKYADVRSLEEIVALPEHEWRIEVVTVLQTLAKRVEEATDIAADTQELVNREVLAMRETLAEMSGILNTIKGGLQFLGWMGSTAKWIAIMLGVVTATITLIIAASKLPEAWEAYRHWVGRK